MSTTNILNVVRADGVDMASVSINSNPSGAFPLPAGDPFFFTPAVYGPFLGCYIDMTKQGLYSFFAKIITGTATLWDGEAHCVVDQSNPDIEEILRALMARNFYGNADEGKTFSQLLDLIRLQEISVACTTAAQFASYVIGLFGIQSRVALVLTTLPLNGYLDGHTMVEVKINGKFVLYDMSFNRKFVDASGNALSLADIVDLGVENVTEYPMWPVAVRPQVWDTTQQAIRLDTLVQNYLLTPKMRAQTTANLAQLPALYWPGGSVAGAVRPAGYYFFVPAQFAGNEARITSYSSIYFVVTRAIWNQMFPL